MTLAFGLLAPVVTTSIAGTIIVNNVGSSINALNFTNLSPASNVITGTVTNNGGTVTASTVNTTFGAGSQYNHAMDNGAITGANWNANSTCTLQEPWEIILPPLVGTFGNLIWNCAGQTANGALSGEPQ